MAAKKKRTVADLVTSSKSAPRFTQEQHEQIAEALAHNERCPVPDRLSSERVCQLLRDEYGLTIRRTAFEHLVCAEFGRTSWARK